MIPEVPYTDASATLSVNYSRSWNSAYGKLGRSFADMLGIDPKNMTVDNWVGGTYRMQRTVGEIYGQNRSTGQTMAGDVWRCAQVMGGGTAPAQIQQGMAPNQQQMQPQPQAQQSYEQQGQPNQQPAQQTVTVPAQTNITPQQRALELLHGKTVNDFWNTAMVDPIIKSDQAFVAKVMDRSFLVDVVAQGFATENPDGTYSVVGR